MTGSKSSKRSRPTDIAIIGMSVWYPGSISLTEFWENILAKRQQFRQMPDCRLPQADYHHHDKNVPDKTYGTEAGVIDGFEYDWQARRVPKKTFESTDIVHWLALEVALKAIEDARLDVKKLQENQTGVILGNTLTGEWTRTNAMRLRWPFMAKVIKETAQNRGLTNETIEDLVKHAEFAFKSVFPNISEDTLAGALSNTIAGRICNVLDLHGGGYTVDGACSSSLLAVETAAQHLVSGSLDVALAGGIDISLDTFELIGFAKTGALTPGEMRVYDKRANGFIPGEGCGFIVLKRLADAERDGDQIYAVIKGWGLSSDGKGGLTAPSIQGQAQAIKKAYEMAGYGISSLHFVEGHGTGTTLGDKVEISALNAALNGEVPKQKIALTSLKSIIGHTKAAAGIGALIKATIAVNQRVIPPLAGIEDPNDLFQKEAVHFYPEITGRVMEETQILRAGVSAMGFGGINTHVTLESYGPKAEHITSQHSESLLLNSYDRCEAVVFSSPTQSGLAKLISFAKEEAKGISRSELSDFAHEKSRLIRLEDKFRIVLVVTNPTELLSAINIAEELLLTPIQAGEVKEKHQGQAYIAASHKINTPKIGFMFPGQGSQKKGMGLELMNRHSWAKKKAQSAQSIVKDSFQVDDLLETGVSNNKSIKDTEIAQPMLSLVGAMTHDLLVRAGIKPSAVLGHSLGELPALYAAQAISFSQLIDLSLERGKVMAAPPTEAGSMAYICAPKAIVQTLMNEVARTHLAGYLTIANHNSPDQIVVSGDSKMVDAIIEVAQSKSITAGKLPVSNAFHSRYMQSSAEKFAHKLDTIDFSEPRLPFVMGSQGTWLEHGSDLKAYLTCQMTDSVDFVSSFGALSEQCDMIIEVGAGNVLTNLGKKIAHHNKKVRILSTLATPGNDYDLKLTLATCFAHGVNVRWNEVFANRFFRPFVPANQKSFIMSPIEKPLAFMSEKVTLSQKVLSEQYITPKINLQEQESSKRFNDDQISHLAPQDRSFAKIPSISDSPQKHKLDDVLESIYSEISILTGFDRQTLHSDMKLLDDLHLDSIKSTEFIGNVSMQYNVAGELSDLQLSNVSLNELATLIMQYSSKNQGHVKEDVSVESSNFLATQLVTPSLSPIDSPSTPVYATLPASPIHSVNDAVPHVEAPAAAPLSPLLPSLPSTPPNLIHKRPVGSETHPTSSGSTGIAQSSRAKNREPWTRNFSEIFVPAPLEAPSDAVMNSWLAEKTLVVAPNAHEAAFALPLNERQQKFAQVETLFVDQDHKGSLNLMPYTNVIVIMNTVKDQLESLTQSIRTLNLLTRSKFARNQKIVFIQNDDGCFGQKNSTSISAKAFAQSLAHERPDLVIRALSLHHSLPKNFPTIEKIGLELAQRGKLIVAGYNQNGERFVPELQLDKLSSYVKRTTTWTSQDVILVTGGAKGITAECAFRFAEKYRVKVVLLGSSAALKGSESQPNHPISAILSRYLDAGLTAQYVCCDITNAQQVAETIRKTEDSFGPITGIIHGAGINHPKLLQSVELGAAIREVSPKTVGMLHLMNAINPNQLKMVIALTSVIGVVGMPGNGWYGFANENLDLLLRRYKAQYPNLSIQSLAYSVWSEIGMGARLGSDKVLEDKGISAIPPSEGVARFLMLAENEGRDQQTIITSRLGSIKLSA